MKQTKQLDEIQAGMAPGIITKDGFLGTDSRKLVDILTSDDALVKRLGTSHEKIAQKMILLRDEGLKGLGDYISVEPGFEVRVESIRGKLPCPFGDRGLFPKTVTMVKNLTLNETVTYTDLSIHCIQNHGFYQGAGSLYRLDPLKLTEILGIGAETADYRTPGEKTKEE